MEYWGLKKKSASRPGPQSDQSARVQLGPGPIHFQSLIDSNFTALWPTDPALTDQSFKKYSSEPYNLDEHS